MVGIDIGGDEDDLEDTVGVFLGIVHSLDHQSVSGGPVTSEVNSVEFSLFAVQLECLIGGNQMLFFDAFIEEVGAENSGE